MPRGVSDKSASAAGWPAFSRTRGFVNTGTDNTNNATDNSSHNNNHTNNNINTTEDDEGDDHGRQQQQLSHSCGAAAVGSAGLAAAS